MKIRLTQEQIRAVLRSVIGPILHQARRGTRADADIGRMLRDVYRFVYAGDLAPWLRERLEKCA